MKLLKGFFLASVLGAQVLVTKVESRSAPLQNLGSFSKMVRRADSTQNNPKALTAQASSSTSKGNNQPNSDRALKNNGYEPGATGSQKVLAMTVKDKPKYRSKFRMDSFLESNLNYADTAAYAELINNRAFQTPADAEFGRGQPSEEDIGSGSLARWQPVGQSSISLTLDHPLSDSLPKSALVTYNPSVKPATSPFQGKFGIMNTGFFGFNVKREWKYKLSFYIRADKAGRARIQAGLYTADANRQFGGSTLEVDVTQQWQQVKAEFQPTDDAPDQDNVFAFILDGNGGVQQIQINLISLFPPTWEDTVIRRDYAEAILQFKPKDIRWPGGNSMRGVSVKSRFEWKDAIGELKDRRGRLGVWNSWMTNGLGPIEMYNFINKIGAEAIVGLWAGSDGLGKSVPVEEMGPYVKEQVEFLHFLLDTDGKFAEWRIKSGGPKDPYKVSGIMIGNEGSETPAVSYNDRFQLIYEEIKREFPLSKYPSFGKIDIIATAPVKVPKGSRNYLDTLNKPRYGTPNDFVQAYHEYDNMKRDNTIYYNMEFAVINDGTSPDQDLWGGPGRLNHCILIGSLAEAIFLLGLEKNSDITKGAAAAPELSNLADLRADQSTPGQLEFDSAHMVKSSSFLVQQGVGAYRILNVLEVDGADDLERNGVYYSAGSDDKGRVIVKFVNYDSVQKTIEITTGRKSGTVEQYVVTGDGPRASNVLGHENEVHHTTTTFQSQDGVARVTLARYSFNAIAIP